MEGVGLDPLTAIKEAAQVPQGAGDLHSQSVLHGVHRAHLVGHRADAADAGGDIRGFVELPASQESLEEPGRLEDLQLDFGHGAAFDPEVEAAFALHPGQHIDLDGSTFHGLRSPGGTPGRWRRNYGRPAPILLRRSQNAD